MSRTMQTLVMAGAVSVLVASSAVAHHIRGIPHYGYSEHYPDTPVFTEERTVDNFKIIFSYYEIPGHKAMDLAFHVKDLETSKPYAGALVLQVFRNNEDPTKSHPYEAFRNPTNTYKVGWVYEQEDTYTARVKIVRDGKEIKEDFRIQVGEVDAATGMIAVCFAAVLLLMVAVGIAHRRRQAQDAGAKQAQEAVNAPPATDKTENHATATQDVGA